MTERSVGGYDVIRELGRGGMAIVYLARQRELDREVALKELSALHVTDPDGVRRFLRESRLAGSLSHPCIVTVHDLLESDGTPYIAMEYLERGSLRPWVGKLNATQSIGVLRDVLSGLGHAAKRGIVHRDLKPENLLVTDDGGVKITDYGIAKALGQAADTNLTRTGTTMGTPAYMAPEQAMGTEISPATDLYSLGVIAYELLAGRPPFEPTGTPMAVLLRHVQEPVPPLLSVAPGVDPQLAAWVEGLLAKQPEDRPASADAARERLEEIAFALYGPRWQREAAITEEEPRPRPREESVEGFVTFAPVGDAAATEAEPATQPKPAPAPAPGPEPPPAPEPPAAPPEPVSVPDAESTLAVAPPEPPPAPDPPAAPSEPEPPPTPSPSPPPPAPAPAPATARTQLRPSPPPPRAPAPPSSPSPARRRRPQASVVAAVIALVATVVVLGVIIAGVGGGTTKHAPAPPASSTIDVGAKPDGILVANGHVYVCVNSTGSLVQISPRRSVRVGDSPDSVAFGAGRLWVTTSGDNKVTAIDPDTFRVTRPGAVFVDRAPEGVAVGFGSVWVAGQGGNAVDRLDQNMRNATDPYQATLSPLPNANAIVLGPRAVWIATRGGVVRENPRTNVRSSEIPVGENTRGVALSGRYVYAISTNDDRLVQIDRTTSKVVAHRPLPGSPRGIAAGAGSLWVTLGDTDKLLRIDPNGLSTTRTYPTGRQPFNVAFGDGAVWTSNYGDGTVTRFAIG